MDPLTASIPGAASILPFASCQSAIRRSSSTTIGRIKIVSREIRLQDVFCNTCYTSPDPKSLPCKIGHCVGMAVGLHSLNFKEEGHARANQDQLLPNESLDPASRRARPVAEIPTSSSTSLAEPVLKAGPQD